MHAYRIYREPLKGTVELLSILNTSALVVQATDLLLTPADLPIDKFYFETLQGEVSGL